MDDDGDSRKREFDELVKKLLAHFMGGELPNTLNESGFRIMIACGEVPPNLIPHTNNFLQSNGEPYIEVHTIDDKLKIVAELPGITTRDLGLEVRDGTLYIYQKKGNRLICTSVDLPFIEADTVAYTLSHGVLEVTFNKEVK